MTQNVSMSCYVVLFQIQHAASLGDNVTSFSEAQGKPFWEAEAGNVYIGRQLTKLIRLDTKSVNENGWYLFVQT